MSSFILVWRNRIAKIVSRNRVYYILVDSLDLFQKLLKKDGLDILQRRRRTAAASSLEGKVFNL